MRVADLLRAARPDALRNAAVLDRLSGPPPADADAPACGASAGGRAGGGAGGRGRGFGVGGGETDRRGGTPLPPSPSLSPSPCPPSPSPSPLSPSRPQQPQEECTQEAPQRPPPQPSAAAASPSAPAAPAAPPSPAPSSVPISKLILRALFRALSEPAAAAAAQPAPGRAAEAPAEAPAPPVDRFVRVDIDQASLFLYGLVAPLLARIVAVSTPGLLCIVQLPQVTRAAPHAHHPDAPRRPGHHAGNPREPSPDAAGADDAAAAAAADAAAPAASSACRHCLHGQRDGDDHQSRGGRDEPRQHHQRLMYLGNRKEEQARDGRSSKHLFDTTQHRETPSPGSTPDSTPSPRWSAPSMSPSPADDHPASDLPSQPRVASRPMPAVDSQERPSRQHRASFDPSSSRDQLHGEGDPGANYNKESGGTHTRKQQEAVEADRNSALRLICNGFEVLTGKLPVTESDHREGRVTLASVIWDKAGIITPQKENGVVMSFSNGMVAPTEGIFASFSNGSICYLTIRDPQSVVETLGLSENTPVLLFACNQTEGERLLSPVSSPNPDRSSVTGKVSGKLRDACVQLNMFVVEVGCQFSDSDFGGLVQCDDAVRDEAGVSYKSSGKPWGSTTLSSGQGVADHICSVANDTRLCPSRNQNGRSCGGSGSSSSPRGSNGTRATSAGMDGSRTASCSVPERPDSMEKMENVLDKGDAALLEQDIAAQAREADYPGERRLNTNGRPFTGSGRDDRPSLCSSELPPLLLQDRPSQRAARKRQSRSLSMDMIPNAVALFVNTATLPKRDAVDDDCSPLELGQPSDLARRDERERRRTFNREDRASLHYKERVLGTEEPVVQCESSADIRSVPMSRVFDDQRLAPNVNTLAISKRASSADVNPRANTDTSQGCFPPPFTHMATPSNPQDMATGVPVDLYGAPVAVSMYPYYYGPHHGTAPETKSADGTPCKEQRTGPGMPSLQPKTYYGIPHQAGMAYPAPYPYPVHHPEHHHLSHHAPHPVLYHYPHGYLQAPQYHTVHNPHEVQFEYTAPHDHQRQFFARPELKETHSAADQDSAVRLGCGGNSQVVRESPRGHTASTKSNDSAGALEALVRMGDAPAVMMRHRSERNGGQPYAAAGAGDDSGGSGHSNDADGGSAELDAAIPVAVHSRSKGYGSKCMKPSSRSRAESDASGNSSGDISDSAEEVPPRKRVRH